MQEPTEKKIIREVYSKGDSICEYMDMSIDDAIQTLRNAKKTVLNTHSDAENISIEYEYVNDMLGHGNVVEVAIYYDRQETDGEFDNRVVQWKNLLRMKEESKTDEMKTELKTLEELAKKYGKKLV